MKFYTADDINNTLNFPILIDALREGFTKDYIIPPRMHLNYDNPKDNNQNTLLLMPAVQCGNIAGVKIVNVAPSNNKRNLPSIQGVYYLLDATSGTPKVLMDAKALTNWRTAASSALAADYLASKEASSLFMIGTGALSPFIIDAYSTIRNINHLLVYDIIKEKAQAIVNQKNDLYEKITVVENLEEATPQADIISVATLSKTPLIKGAWLRPGQHIDLIGSFKSDMREADNNVLTKSKIYVDSIEMAPKESGDLVIPLSEGIISLSDIKGDLFQLCQDKAKGRLAEHEITVFKSVGHALEDLVTAQLIVAEEKANR